MLFFSPETSNTFDFLFNIDCICGFPTPISSAIFLALLCFESSRTFTRLSKVSTFLFDILKLNENYYDFFVAVIFNHSQNMNIIHYTNNRYFPQSRRSPMLKDSLLNTFVCILSEFVEDCRLKTTLNICRHVFDTFIN